MTGLVITRLSNASTLYSQVKNNSVNRGHSILLGETINASSIQYRDCERFQIVCPSCREPVFKAERELESDLTTHYLSHYKRIDTEHGCELRVEKLQDAAISLENRTSRGQRLSYFLGVLKSQLAQDRIYSNSAEKSHWRLEKSEAFRIIRDLAYEKALADPEGYFDISLADYFHNLTSVGWGLRTAFDQRKQSEVAKDMWLTVMAPNARSNFDFLCCHSFLYEISAIRNTLEVDKSPDVQYQMTQQFSAIITICEASRSQARSVLDALNRDFLPADFSVPRDGQPDYRSSRLSRILGNVQIGMVGALMAFPYFELLQRKFGDPTKVYPSQEPTFPVIATEVERMRGIDKK
jgi:hypothetical protein